MQSSSASPQVAFCGCQASSDLTLCVPLLRLKSPLRHRMLRVYLIGTLLIWPWVIRLGGPGLVLLGIADNSIVPLTGSMDVLTLWLAAGHRNLWPYYALMATIGAVIGGY